jgi:F0F1-type ATP synthase epsilon subunit
MLFFLATPEYNNVQSNTTKVKVHLKNGVAEIFDQHQDLMGRVDNNIVEIESNSEKTLFILQDAVFVVSTKGLDKTSEVKGTGVYVYARRAKEIKSTISLDEITKEFDKKNLEVEEITKIINDQTSESAKTRFNSKLILLKDEVAFLKKVLVMVKDLK